MRYTVKLQGQDGHWADVLYTDDHTRAARLVAVASNPRVRDGRVVDTQQEQRKEIER